MRGWSLATCLVAGQWETSVGMNYGLVVSNIYVNTEREGEGTPGRL